MENAKPPAFISYARNDEANALRLARDLKNARANVWRASMQERAQPGYRGQ